MTRSPKQFAQLFNLALDRIKRLGKKKELVKREIAVAIHATADLIEHWQRGNCPATHDQTEIAAKILFDQKGLANRDEVESLLGYAGHPSPATVWNAWFAKIHGPQVDEDAVFLGREGKVTEVCEVLKPRKVVVLWGPGGVGKTSLVNAVIDRLAPNKTTSKQFPDGILYYDFYGPEHTADAALRYIADFFEIKGPESLPPRDVASKALEGKQALIVLDGAHTADDLSKIVRIRHNCGILIVSRYQHLHQANETIYLDILAPNEAIAVLRAWSMDKKQPAAFQVWTNEPEEVPIAHEICEALGRLPLALRLAGRYMLHPGMKPTQFLDLWRTWRLSLFHDSPHAQQHDSVQLLIEKSLEQVEQMSPGVGAVLAVAGFLSYQPFNTEVIAAALEKSPSLVTKLLQDLWKFSLVRSVSNERWQVLHRLIYTYAQSIESPVDVTVRLTAYYTKLVEEQSNLHQEGYKRLDAERMHMVAIVTGCEVRQRWTEVHSLARSISLYLDRQGYWDDRETILQAALLASRARQDQSTEGTCLNTLGRVYTHKWKLDKAIDLFQQAHQTFAQLGDMQGLAHTYVNLGVVYRNKGKWNKAIEFFQQAQQAFEQLGDIRHLAYTHINLGEVYIDKRELDKATKFFQQAHQTFEGLDDIEGLTHTYQALARVYTLNGEWDKSIAIYQHVRQTFEQLGDICNLSGTYNDLGLVYMDKGEWDKAIEYYQQAHQICKQVGDLHGLALTYNNLGSVYFNKGEWDKAIEYYQQAHLLEEQVGDLHGLALTYNNLGLVYFSKGEWHKAIEYYQQAQQIFEQVDDSYMLAKTCGYLGAIYMIWGQYQSVIEYFKQAEILYDKLEDRPKQCGVLVVLGIAYHALSRYAEAIDAYRTALLLDPNHVSIYNDLGDVYLTLGKLNEAAHQYHQRIALCPEDALNAHVKLGIIALRDGLESKAKKHFETALTVWEAARKKRIHSSFDLLENIAFVFLVLGQTEQAITTLQEALKQRVPSDTIDFTPYNLLAGTPYPPSGLSEMRRLIEEMI